MLNWKNAFACASLVSFACLSGCEQPAPAPTAPAAAPKPEAAAKAEKPHDHGPGTHTHGGHGAGPHEGTLADWGGGKYHVEFTVDHKKKEATVYILGSDEKSATPVKMEKVLLSIKDPAIQVDLKATPLAGEKDGNSSRFVGQHDKLSTVKEFEGTISGEIGGTPYSADFKEEPHGDHDHK